MANFAASSIPTKWLLASEEAALAKKRPLPDPTSSPMLAAGQRDKISDQLKGDLNKSIAKCLLGWD